MCTLVCEGFGVFIVGRVDIHSLAQKAFPCREDPYYYGYFVGSSYLVYAFWSSYSSVVDLKAHPSALWWNRQLYGVIIYKDTSKVVRFVRTISFALCERV